MQTNLRIELQDETIGDEELDALTRALRQDLLYLDLTKVERATAGEAPPGARSGELAAAGTLLVTCAPVVELLVTVVDVLSGRLKHRGHGKADLEVDGMRISLTGHSDESERKLVDEWIALVVAREDRKLNDHEPA